MYESMYFGTPKPFGQHSTAYRAVGGGASVVRPASSMAVLISPGSDAKDETSSATVNSPFVLGSDSRPPMPSANSESSGLNQSAFRKVTVSSPPHRIGTERWMQSGMPQKGRWNSSQAFFDAPSEPRPFERQKTSSMQDAIRSQHQTVTVDVPICRQVPIQIEGQQSLPDRPMAERSVLVPVRTEGAPLSGVKPYHEEFHTTMHSYSDARRPNSAVPFSEKELKTLAPFTSEPGIRQQQEQGESKATSQCLGSGANAASEGAQFDRVQVFRGRQKPAEQPERQNYTSLHHIPARPSYIQRRTSDPTISRMGKSPAAATVAAPFQTAPTQEESEVPTTHAMVNVAKNVREELEQDPKFRQRAESTGERMRRIAPSAFHPPRQSPSLLQMENYLSHLQRHQSAMELSQVPLTSSAQPFSADAVRNIFSGVAPSSQVSKHTDQKTAKDPDFASTSSLNATPTSPSPHIRTVTVKTYYEPTKSKLREPPHVAINAFGIQPQIRSAPVPPPKPQMYSSGYGTGDTDGDKLSGSSVFKIRMTNGAESCDQKKEIEEHGEEPDTTVPERAIFVARPRSLKYSFEDETASQSAQSASSPPGILLKNPPHSMPDTGVTKPQKRVVFQCDEQSVRRMVAGDCCTDTTNGTSVPQETPPCVRQYDDTVEEPLQRFLKLSCDIGGDVKTIGEKVSSAFTQQRNFIWNAAGQKEPSAAELQTKVESLVKLLEEVSTIRESKRNTPQFHHLSAVSEGIQALGWLTVKPTPAPFIKDMNEASMFFVNRVRNENKDGDKVHLEWTKAWVELLESLQTYVRQVHTTGLVWNSNPMSSQGAVAPSSAGKGSSSSSAPPPGGPPPPPPPPPGPPPDLSTKSDGADRAALFAEINKGADITKGLKKVTADMQTHKNPALRAQGPASGDITKVASKATPSSTEKEEVVKPAKTWLENGKQWNVEYHKNNQNIIVEIGSMKQTVYVFKCENSVVQVKGKVNSITLDSCTKTSIVFDSLLSQVEVINCQGVQIQTLGTMPTLSIQKTDGCQVYLSKEAMGAEIVTSKSSGMNVLVPTDADGDFMEFPVPEQFKTVFDGKKLQTTVSDIV
ncbi:Adenylyl cyclase-associated protein 1 [Toxocara canis]|uniref:Adenylyl cyclase-associated protein 1 n=1 Tax=Toxocara canis TaxID=6265 RepID=A0A0B2UNH4_TOXCA|nr:Adenylyl cyclase-associated protein 1 [Toxocara canis]